MIYAAKETAWIGSDNEVEWVLFQEGSPMVLLSSILRAVVSFGSVTLDSSSAPSDVWWTDSVVDRPLRDGSLFTGQVLKARLGRTLGLVGGEYDNVRLTVYNASHPNGLVVADTIYVTVKDV